MGSGSLAVFTKLPIKVAFGVSFRSNNERWEKERGVWRGGNYVYYAQQLSWLLIFATLDVQLFIKRSRNQYLVSLVIFLILVDIGLIRPAISPERY